MPTTAKELVTCCLRDEFPSSLPVIVDYFGKNLDNERFTILFGVYQGLVIRKGVDENMLHKCLLANRLDELIHNKFKHEQTGYYKMFCDKNITVDDHYSKDMSFIIYSDDFCPNCLTEGFITNNNRLDIDCPKCLKFICYKCGMHTTEGKAIHKTCNL